MYIIILFYLICIIIIIGYYYIITAIVNMIAAIKINVNNITSLHQSIALHREFNRRVMRKRKHTRLIRTSSTADEWIALSLYY